MAKLPIKELKPDGINDQVPRTAGELIIWANHVCTTKDKNLVPNKTFGDNSSTGLLISSTPISDGHVEVEVNGAQQILGDGVNTKDCYFIGNDVWSIITGGNLSAGALRTDKSAWSWGQNTNGRCGDNTTIDRSSPVSVVGTHSFVEMESTHLSVVAYKSDGTLWCWGTNTNGEVGDNTTNNRSSPVSVVGNHSVIHISGGDGYSAALKIDGSIWSWGSGGSGQIGDNTTNSRSSPVSIVGAHSFIKLSIMDHSMGLKSNGTIWCWGLGTSGQLGQGTSVVNRSSPVSVVGNHSFISINVGLNMSTALKSDGSCWAWGSNASGRLGDNTTNDRSSPISVVGAHSFIKIISNDVGSGHTLGLKFDGSVWTWGIGSSGELGDNTTNNRSSPISILNGGLKFVSIAVGNGSSYALATDGSVWAWGSNITGQLGINTVSGKSSPISVLNGGSAPIRSISNIAIFDKLIWNGGLSGFDLMITDNVDLNYIGN